MLELQNVKGYSNEEYKYILLHCGNSEIEQWMWYFGRYSDKQQGQRFGWVGASRNNYLRTYQLLDAYSKEMKFGSM